jgi:hypothetical protein
MTTLLAPLLVETVDTDLDTTSALSPSECAHIVKTAPGENAAVKVMDARLNGTPLTALCGYVWVPSRNPLILPVCPKCKDVYDMYRSFSDAGLVETPGI